MAAALPTELLQTPVEAVCCLEHRREACRNEAVAIFDMLVMVVEKRKQLLELEAKESLSEI
jgi:hypothetical protein